MSKVCKNCGALYNDDATICSNCGGQLENASKMGETVVLSDLNVNSGNAYAQQDQGYQHQAYQQQENYMAGNRPGARFYEGQGQAYNNGNTQFQQTQMPPYDQNIVEDYPKSMGMIEAYVAFWKNYVNFSGRARRSEYWYVMLMNIILGIVFFILGRISVIGFFTGILSGIYSLAILIPTISLAIRRLHDTGKSGWLYLLILIPLVGSIIMIVFFATDSQYGPNAYGENPKGMGNPINQR